jgi:hypothetical protein
VNTCESFASHKGVSEIRSLLDDTSVYGADCGFSNPNGEAQPVPTDGKATFERVIQHVVRWCILPDRSYTSLRSYYDVAAGLDDKIVFHEDDCYTKYGNEDVSVKSGFLVDYSQCETLGCNEMSFYWLAFEGVDNKTVWQVYSEYSATETTVNDLND